MRRLQGKYLPIVELCHCLFGSLVVRSARSSAESLVGLYDYAAVVPVVVGAGGHMTDWTGATLSIPNHEASKGRVVALVERFDIESSSDFSSK